MTLRMCRLMVSRMHLVETDGAVWLFPASSGAATLVGVIHLIQPSRTCPPGGHALAAVYARVIWSLASELGGLPAAVAVVFRCGAGRVLVPEWPGTPLGSSTSGSAQPWGEARCIWRETSPWPPRCSATRSG